MDEAKKVNPPRPDNFIDALKEDLRLQEMEIVRKGALKAQFDAGVVFGFKDCQEKAAKIVENMSSGNVLYPAVGAEMFIRELRPGGDGKP